MSDLALKVMACLVNLARLYPNSTYADLSAEQLAKMAATWADMLDTVPVSRVEELYKAVLQSHASRFAPECGDFYTVWVEMAKSEYRDHKAAAWMRDDVSKGIRPPSSPELKMLAPAEPKYSESLPIGDLRFKERGAAVVCYCKYERDGMDKSAQLTPDGTKWRCERYGLSDGCTFEWLASDVISAHLPAKSYNGPESAQVVAATRRAQEAMANTFDDEPETLDAVNDGTILTTMETIGFDMSRREQALEFGRYVWEQKKIHPSLWTLALVKTKWPDFCKVRRGVAA
jgi:hypothetical protein